MSDTTTQTTTGTGQQDATVAVIGVLFAAVAACVLAWLAIPMLVRAVAGERIATKAFFWRTSPWQLVAAIAGVAAIAALLVTEAVLVQQYVAGGGWASLRATGDVANQLVAGITPWVVGNLVAGGALLPAWWLIYRRQLNRRVQLNRVRDVGLQDGILRARTRAADLRTAAEMGVTVDAVTGRITGVATDAARAPYPVAGQRLGFGRVVRGTIASAADLMRDRREVRDWTIGANVCLPASASACRALVIAESGSGKTVLLNGVILCALAAGWQVVFVDAKGDPDDGDQLAALARTSGYSVTHASPWNLFTGDAAQITEKLMRLMPPPDGANQHYLDEIRGVLQAVQHHRPLVDLDDLKARLLEPAEHVRDRYDLHLVTAVVSREGLTAAERVLHSLSVALRPLEQMLDPHGWSYANPGGQLVIQPLSPADDAQARLGDLMLADLRHFMANRLKARDKSPMLVIIDEFAQLVTGTSDPGDTAAALYETARSAGMGLLLAAQSTAGLSNDETRRRRALTSGAALLLGRSKDPEDVVMFAGTVMRSESSGDSAGTELRSARAQHTFLIAPQDVREASDGTFWLVQAGRLERFRALPTQVVTA